MDKKELLDQVLDSMNDGVSRHLGQIANCMYEWEGQVADELGLSLADVAAIKHKYPRNLKLQSREALEMWKQKLDSPTYNDLIGVFERAGYDDYVCAVKEIFYPQLRTSGYSTRIPIHIQKYAKCLKELYLEKSPFPHPEWPPTEATEPTKLVMINLSYPIEEGFSKMVVNSTEYDYVHERDNIPAYRKEIELEDILKPVQFDKNKPPKEPKVLMDGAPGVGKTTLALKACTEWANGHLFSDYELVILVSLRQTEYRNAKNLGDLFPQTCYHDQQVIDHYSKNNGRRLVLIFDGYDELTSEQREYKSVFLDIIRGEMLPKAAVIVTSRHYASNHLQNLRSINRHVELVGFKKEQVYACIQKNISDSSSANSLMKQLEEREDILSLCYIPLNCMIMIHVYKQKGTLSTTMTELFHQFIVDSVKRDVTVSPKEVEQLDNLPHPTAEQLHSLEKLAYQNLLRDQLVFSEKELRLVFKKPSADDAISQCLGLMTSVYASNKTERHFQFLHLSIQEFLAARYAVKNLSNQEQTDTLRDYVNNPRFKLFLLFYVGMMPLKSDVAQVLFNSELNPEYESSRDNSIVRKFLYFAHMIYESRQFDSFLCLFNSYNKSSLVLKQYRLTLFDCTILAHYLCTIQHSYNELDLQDCSLSVQSLQVFDRVYHQCQSGKKLTFKSINFSNNDSEIVNHLHLFPWLNDVDQLTLTSRLNNVSHPLQLSHLAHIPNLNINVNDLFDHCCVCTTTATNITLCQASLGEPFVKYLCGVKALELTRVEYKVVQVIDPFLKSLKCLVLCEVDDVDVWLSHSALKLAESTSLQKLKVLDVQLSAVCVTKLFQSLQSNTSIEELSLSGKDMLDGLFLHQEVKVGQALKALLAINTTISSLQLCNCMNDQLTQYLISGLTTRCALQSLDVTRNPLAISTIQYLTNVACNCSKLSLLSIENKTFVRHGVAWSQQNHNVMPTTKLFCTLFHVKQLKKINVVKSVSISNKNIPDAMDSLVCTRLFQTLQQNKYLKSLTLDEEFQIIAADESVISALERMLAVNNTLESLHYCSSTVDQPDPHPVCKHLAAGISKSVSMTMLSLEVQSCSDIICILRGLSYSCTLKVLQLQSKNNHTFIQMDCKQIGSEFEQFLKKNSMLVKLALGHNLVDDNIIDGITMGLMRNRSLKKIIILSKFCQRGTVRNLIPLISKSKLNGIELRGICSLNRKGCMDWDVKIYENGFVSWSQLKCFFNVETAVEPNETYIKFKTLAISDHHGMIYPSPYQMCEIFRALSLSGNLKVINVRELTTIDYYDELGKTKVGLALKELLTKCSSLEILTFNAKLPSGTWKLAAKGLSINGSLKCLDLRNCYMEASEAACIFDALKSNQSLEKLDVSENFEVKKESYEVICAIEKMFRLNSSLKEVNLKLSVNDKMAMKAAMGLQKNSSSKLRQLVLDERSLSISTIHHLLSLLKDNDILTLMFDNVSIHSNQIADDDFILKLVKDSYDMTLKSNKLFCGICNTYLQSNLVLNIIELKLNFVDNEVVIVIFRSLSHKSLSKLAKLSFVKRPGHKIGGSVVGDELKRMLECNNTLHELNFHEVDELLVSGLTSGLLKNNSLRKVEFSVCMSEHLVTELLNVMESPDTGILKIDVPGLPTIHRHTRSSTWCMTSSKTVFIDRESWFMFILCKLYEDNTSRFSRSAKLKCILDSRQHLTLTINQRDFPFVEKYLELLNTNNTFTEFSLIGNGKLTKDCSLRLGNAIKNMLIKNKTVNVLCLLGTLNDIVAAGIVAGLKGNKTVKELAVDRDALTPTSLASIFNVIDSNVSGLTLFKVSGIFILQQLEDSLWHIKIYNAHTWHITLNVLKKYARESKILAILIFLTSLECLHHSTKFDLTGEILNLSGNFQIKSLLEEMNKISHLTLNGCNISDTICKDIANGLGSSNLKMLDLSSNSILGMGAMELFQALEVNHTIVEFNVSDNSLKEISICECVGPALSRMLQSNTSLKVLKLKECHLGDESCDFISSGLQDNSTLTCLDLSNNNISSNGAIVIMQSLQKNHCLQELNLNGNNLCKVTAKMRLSQSVCEMLESNKSLTTLKLSNCGIDDTVLKEIANGLTKNTTLKTLALNLHQYDSNTFKSLTKGNLTCLISSNACSFLRSDCGWVMEVQKDDERCLQIFSLCELDIKNVVISKHTDSALNLTQFCFNCSQLVSIFESLGHNKKLNFLTVHLTDTLANAKQESLAEAVTQMLEKNRSLKYLTLYGAVDNRVLKGLETGLETNTTLDSLIVQFDKLEITNTVNFLQSMESTRLLSVRINSLIEISRVDVYSVWCISSYSPSFLQYLCCLSPNLKSYGVLSQIYELDLSGFDLLLKEVRDSGMILNAFEGMMSHKSLQYLIIDNIIDDSVVVAISKGLKNNNTIHTIDINIDPLSEDVLGQLLQSLSNYPLKLVDKLDGTHVRFIRCVSEQQTEERCSDQHFPKNRHLQSLGKVLQSFTPDNELKILIITTLPRRYMYSNITVGSEAMSNGLKTMLSICKSLQTFKLLCPVKAEVIEGLCTGLKENSTLQHLEINSNISDILPIFTPLNSSGIIRLVLIEQYLFFRVPGSTNWTIKVLRHSSIKPLMIDHLGLNIDTIICPERCDDFELEFRATNTESVLPILRSIECGNICVKTLQLVYDGVTYDDKKLSEDIGIAIERMLQSKELATLLETLTVRCLKDNVIQEHLVSGLSQSSKLACVQIEDKLQDIRSNNLVQILFNTDFTNSSIHRLKINDDITLYKITKNDPCSTWLHEAKIVWGETELDPEWKVEMGDKNTVATVFSLLSPMFPRLCHYGNVFIGEIILESLKKLDLSCIHIDLAALFEVLEHDERVVDLNLSCCTPVVSPDGLDIHQLFKNMLERNKSLKVLNLTGIMDDTFATSLIEVLHNCSLSSLSIDVNINICTVDRVEAILHSFVSSTLQQLHFINVCLLLKESSSESCNPVISCETTHSFSNGLDKTWRMLVMAISRVVPRLELTLAPHDALSVKCFTTFFNSMEDQQHIDNNAAVTLLQSLTGLHIGVTCHNQGLIIAVINSIHYCSNLTKLCLSHDMNISRFVSNLAPSYEKLLHTSDTLQTLTLGSINDEIAQSIALGLIYNNKLQTLQFSLGSVSPDSLAHLLQSILKSNLTCVQITDGCTISRRSNQDFQFLHIARGNNILLSKLFLASTKICPNYGSSLKLSLMTDNVLDLNSNNSLYPIDSCLATHIFKCIMVEEANCVSKLILSGNKCLFGGDRDELVSSVLKQLLLSKVSNLHTLKLDACEMSDKVCIKISEGLTTNSSLQVLDLSYNRLTIYGVSKLLASLVKNYTLKELHLSQFSSVPANYLEVKEVAIGSEIETMIKANSSLSVLSLSLNDSNSCEALCKHIAIGLGCNSALRVLNFELMKEKEVLIQLAKSVQQNQCLTELNIARSSVKTKVVGAAIQEMLKCNTSLKVLNLEGCKISDEVCVLITEGLAQNRTLKVLNISANKIYNDGIVRLFQMLDESVCSLQELDISFNYTNLYSKIMKCGSVLAKNSTLEILAVSGCGCFEECQFGLELLEGLKQNSSSKIFKLDVSQNIFDEQATTKFTEMLLHNKTLAQLDINSCQFTPWEFSLIETLPGSSVKNIIVDIETKRRLLDLDCAASELEFEIVDL